MMVLIQLKTFLPTFLLSKAWKTNSGGSGQMLTSFTVWSLNLMTVQNVSVRSSISLSTFIVFLCQTVKTISNPCHIRGRQCFCYCPLLVNKLEYQTDRDPPQDTGLFYLTDLHLIAATPAEQSQHRKILSIRTLLYWCEMDDNTTQIVYSYMHHN